MAAMSPWTCRAGPEVCWKANIELVGDDGGEGGFAEAGRSEEEDVVEGLAAGLGGLEGDG